MVFARDIDVKIPRLAFLRRGRVAWDGGNGKAGHRCIERISCVFLAAIVHAAIAVRIANFHSCIGPRAEVIAGNVRREDHIIQRDPFARLQVYLVRERFIRNAGIQVMRGVRFSFLQPANLKQRRIFRAFRARNRGTTGLVFQQATRRFQHQLFC